MKKREKYVAWVPFWEREIVVAVTVTLMILATAAFAAFLLASLP